MRHILFYLIQLVLGVCTAYSQTADIRDCVIHTATSQIGVVEDGANAGKDVEKYLRYTSTPVGSPWCSSFCCWTLAQHCLNNSHSAWSPSFFPQNKIVYDRDKHNSDTLVKTGDLFGIYFPEKKRIAHVGFVEQWGDWVITIEGNTNSGGSRDGDGVYRRKRQKSKIYQVSNWID